MAWRGGTKPVLCRHGQAADAAAYARPHRQRRPILAGELPLGYADRPSTKQAEYDSRAVRWCCPKVGRTFGTHRRFSARASQSPKTREAARRPDETAVSECPMPDLTPAEELRFIEAGFENELKMTDEEMVDPLS